MTDTVNLGLPCIDAAQAQKHVTHNEALRILDTLVQLAIIDRDLTTPPGSPGEGQRWIVAATPTGAWLGHANHVAAWQDGAWQFSVAQLGWLAYIIDEGRLLAWNGSAWTDAMSMLTTLQNIALLGVGTTADVTNPFSAKLNNALWTAKTVAEGGDGNIRYKMSKESAAKTLSILLQDNFSGRAEIGLTGDDDFHFKTSADGTSWIDALTLDKTTGAAKLNSAFFLTGDITPAQLTADQNDYNPAGLAGASVLRLSSDASRTITGLAGGGDGRVTAVINADINPIVLKDASTSSSAANRFGFGGDVTLAAKQAVILWYDATDSRWKLLSAAGSGGSSSGVIVPPQGRLTLASGTPVLSANATAQATVYYTPHLGAFYPWYDGAHWQSRQFAELSLALDSTSGHAGYHQSGKLFDLFVTNDAGTDRLGTGPAWSSNTARGTGAGTTELQQLGGIWTNKNSMTLRFASSSGDTITVTANQATYVGTLYATANGQTGMNFKPGPAAGGTNNILGLYNAYNRVKTWAICSDSNNWTYGTSTWRAADNSNSNRISFVDGLQQSTIRSNVHMSFYTDNTGIGGYYGIVLDSTSATPAHVGNQAGNINATFEAPDRFLPQLGFHYAQQVEWSSGASSHFNGGTEMALTVELDM